MLLALTVMAKCSGVNPSEVERNEAKKLYFYEVLFGK
jgi:hypothetical protein